MKKRDNISRERRISQIAALVARVQAEPGSGKCLTMESEVSPEIWAQYMDGAVNVPVADMEVEEASLEALGGFYIEAFEPGVNLTVTLDDEEPEAIAGWMHDYIVLRLLPEGAPQGFIALIEQL